MYIFPQSTLIISFHFFFLRHKDQKRKGHSTPYIVHPVDVANILSECGVTDPEVLEGALLHDTVEDTGATLDQIEEMFGKTVRQYVAEVSDNKSLGKAERKRLQIMHAKKASPGGKLIKLGDKLSNLRSIIADGDDAPWDREVCQGYFLWAKRVCENAYGVNKKLDGLLQDLFANGKLHMEGKEYPVIPEGDEEENLRKYYKKIDPADDEN